MFQSCPHPRGGQTAQKRRRKHHQGALSQVPPLQTGHCSEESWSLRNRGTEMTFIWACLWEGIFPSNSGSFKKKKKSSSSFVKLPNVGSSSQKGFWKGDTALNHSISPSPKLSDQLDVCRSFFCGTINNQHQSTRPAGEAKSTVRPKNAKYDARSQTTDSGKKERADGRRARPSGRLREERVAVGPLEVGLLVRHLNSA